MDNLWKKLENFWYHYKWRTIIISFFVVIAVVCLIQTFQKENFDYYVIYVGDENITDTRQSDIVNSFKKIGIDTDKNGKVTINFSQLVYDPSSAEYHANGTNSNAEQYLGTMAVLPYYIYIMPEEIYLRYKDTGVFVQLSEVFGDKLPASAYDECALYLNKTNFAKNNPGVNLFSDNTVVALKVVPYVSDKNGLKKEQNLFTNHMILFKEIVYYGE